MERLKKIATCIYIAVEAPVADDVSSAIRQAIALIEQGVKERERLATIKHAGRTMQVDPQYAFDQWQIVKAKLAARDAELDEARAKLGGAVMFGAVGGRLMSRIFEAADMTLPDATDVELQLVRLLSELTDLRTQLQTATERAERAEREVERLTVAKHLNHTSSGPEFCEFFTEIDHKKAEKIIARSEALRAVADGLSEALVDMRSGWRYIRANYGDLYGVGWDRCEKSSNEALARYHAAVAEQPNQDREPRP